MRHFFGFVFGLLLGPVLLVAGGWVTPRVGALVNSTRGFFGPSEFLTLAALMVLALVVALVLVPPKLTPLIPRNGGSGINGGDSRPRFAAEVGGSGVCPADCAGLGRGPASRGRRGAGPIGGWIGAAVSGRVPHSAVFPVAVAELSAAWRARGRGRRRRRGVRGPVGRQGRRADLPAGLTPASLRAPVHPQRGGLGGRAGACV